MKEYLIPCPFCGSTDVLKVEGDFINEGGKCVILWDVECQNCYAIASVTVWNQRVHADVTRED